jgi:hypothetical protein
MFANFQGLPPALKKAVVVRFHATDAGRWVKKLKPVCRDWNDAAAHRRPPHFVLGCCELDSQKQAQLEVDAFKPQPSVYQN